MARDPLATASWWCAAAAPSSIAAPAELTDAPLRWWPASVPGTAAAALRDCGEHGWEERDFDAEDWWFRTEFSSPSGGPFLLHVDGVATVAQLWIDGVVRWEGESMFAPASVPIVLASGWHELVLCCRALRPRVSERRPRPLWRTRLVAEQNLRFFRTSLIGRMPGWCGRAAPVGPWRPLRLQDLSEPAAVITRHLRTEWRGEDALASVVLTLTSRPDGPATISVGEHRAEAQLSEHDGRVELRAAVAVPHPRRWWPHTHGEPYRYPVRLERAGKITELGAIGFRSLHVDRTNGAFSLHINDTKVFCRGACWVPPDVVALSSQPAALRDALEQARDAHMNMVRVPGTMVYEPDAFFELCDELGLLVWQDCMLANVSPPEDEAFIASFSDEVRELCDRLAGHASVAVVSGGSEVEQQAAMAGAARPDWVPRLIGETVPSLLAERLPDVAYVTSSPTGGNLPFSTDEGIAHYFGVGAYLRPLEDARRADVRFAAECLAFSNPPSRDTVEEDFGSPALAGHAPAWKKGVPRDDGASWDFEDVTNVYVRRLFGVDPLEVRYADPERALDLERATTAHLVGEVLSEWRRPQSRCQGAIVLSLRDVAPGAGWGLVDGRGRPKSVWHAFRRAAAPIALFASDEGLSGLRLHVVNETATTLRATLRVELFSQGEVLVDHAAQRVELAGRGSWSVDLSALFDRFIDSTYAYRFGVPEYDVVAAFLEDEGGAPLAEVVCFPLGLARPSERDLGLEASGQVMPNGDLEVQVSTRRAAQFVTVEAPGFVAGDSWFHLAPGHCRRIVLRRLEEDARARPVVQALNGQFPSRVALAASVGTS